MLMTPLEVTVKKGVSVLQVAVLDHLPTLDRSPILQIWDKICPSDVPLVFKIALHLNCTVFAHWSLSVQSSLKVSFHLILSLFYEDCDIFTHKTTFPQTIIQYFAYIIYIYTYIYIYIHNVKNRTKYKYVHFKDYYFNVLREGRVQF